MTTRGAIFGWFRNRTALDHWLAIFALVLGGGAVVQTIAEYALAPSGPPVVMERTEVLGIADNGVGYTLHVRVWREKTRNDCPVQSTRVLIHEGTRHIYDVRSETTLGGAAGTPYVDVDYPLPRRLSRGRYTLRVSLAYLCPEETFIIPQPDTSFFWEGV